jgi:hypothetical protein
MQADQAELHDTDRNERGSEGILTAVIVSSPWWLLLLLLAGGVPIRKAAVYLISLIVAAVAVWFARRYHPKQCHPKESSDHSERTLVVRCLRQM